MIDLQVCFPVEVIPLVAVRQVQGAGPRTLDISGSDFRSVDQVLINEIPSSQVVVVSETRLLAVVPSIITQQVIRSISVLSLRLTASPRSIIFFKIGKQPSKVRGILRLVQLFLKILLTTPGRDIFTKKVGGAALKNIGRTFGKSQSGGIVSDLVLSVETTSRQILSVQGRDASLPFDERLLSAKITQSSFDTSTASLMVSIELTSAAGQAATANLVV